MAYPATLHIKPNNEMRDFEISSIDSIREAFLRKHKIRIGVEEFPDFIVIYALPDGAEEEKEITLVTRPERESCEEAFIRVVERCKIQFGLEE